MPAPGTAIPAATTAEASGGGTALGLAATALPGVCTVWLKARAAHYKGEIKLNKVQLEGAQRAEIIIRGLADVGIVALGGQSYWLSRGART